MIWLTVGTFAGIALVCAAHWGLERCTVRDPGEQQEMLLGFLGDGWRR